jgi:hypothetical protein
MGKPSTLRLLFHELASDAHELVKRRGGWFTGQYKSFYGEAPLDASRRLRDTENWCLAYLPGASASSFSTACST